MNLFDKFFRGISIDYIYFFLKKIDQTYTADNRCMIMKMVLK